jgi:hypothetical protein
MDVHGEEVLNELVKKGIGSPLGICRALHVC